MLKINGQKNKLYQEISGKKIKLKYYQLSLPKKKVEERDREREEKQCRGKASRKYKLPL